MLLVCECRNFPSCLDDQVIPPDCAEHALLGLVSRGDILPERGAEDLLAGLDGGATLRSQDVQGGGAGGRGQAPAERRDGVRHEAGPGHEGNLLPVHGGVPLECPESLIRRCHGRFTNPRKSPPIQHTIDRDLSGNQTVRNPSYIIMELPVSAKIRLLSIS